MSLDDDVFPLPRREVCDRVRERRRGEKTGVGKDNPNKHLVDILPSIPKLITVLLRSWHSSVATRRVRVQRERMEKARQRWRERVRVSKQEGLCCCLFVCVCVCALLDMESALGQEPQWSASRPACVSMWRPAKPECKATVTQIDTLSHTVTWRDLFSMGSCAGSHGVTGSGQAEFYSIICLGRMHN